MFKDESDKALEIIEESIQVCKKELGMGRQYAEILASKADLYSRNADTLEEALVIYD